MQFFNLPAGNHVFEGQGRRQRWSVGAINQRSSASVAFFFSIWPTTVYAAPLSAVIHFICGNFTTKKIFEHHSNLEFDQEQNMKELTLPINFLRTSSLRPQRDQVTPTVVDPAETVLPWCHRQQMPGNA